eukprot:scaffold249688_cov30-Tisochrysis_lutea.AAC.1
MRCSDGFPPGWAPDRGAARVQCHPAPAGGRGWAQRWVAMHSTVLRLLVPVMTWVETGSGGVSQRLGMVSGFLAIT